MVGQVGVVKSSFVGNNPKNKNVSNLLTGLPKGEAGKNNHTVVNLQCMVVVFLSFLWATPIH